LELATIPAFSKSDKSLSKADSAGMCPWLMYAIEKNPGTWVCLSMKKNRREEDLPACRPTAMNTRG
jgi:hypothetical protein